MNKTKLWDKGKTVLLNVLVLMSFWLSWMLWNSQPNYEYIDPSRYVKPQPFGDIKQVKDLVKPGSIVFHYGDQRHTKTLPDKVYFRYVTQDMKKWYFYDFESVELEREQWQYLLEKQEGLEVIYPDEMPLPLLQELFPIREEIENSLRTVKRIWLYYDETDSVMKALFISNRDEQVMMARTSFTLTDLKNFLALGSHLKEQDVFYAHQSGLAEEGRTPDPFLHVYYVPKERVTMRQFRLFYQPITAYQMVQTLFVDPSITRQIIERDGTMIFTDGSRGVQIPAHQRTLTYHDPVFEPVTNPVLSHVLPTAVDYVNRKGGWTGDFILEKMSGTDSSQDEYRFRQYERSYPVYGPPGEPMGSIMVRTEGTSVTGYERPLFQMDRFIDYENKTLMSGAEVWHALPSLGVKPEQVERLFLGYRIRMYDDYLNLIPVWVIDTGEKELTFYDGIPQQQEWQKDVPVEEENQSEAEQEQGASEGTEEEQGQETSQEQQGEQGQSEQEAKKGEGN